MTQTKADRNILNSVDPSWKSYDNSETGLSIKYPPSYEVHTNQAAALSDNQWRSKALFAVYDPAETSNYEFHVLPLSVVVHRQPKVANQAIYHTVEEYQKSELGKFEMAIDQDGEIVSINGMSAISYRFEKGDAEDAATHTYLFMLRTLFTRRRSKKLTRSRKKSYRRSNGDDWE